MTFEELIASVSSDLWSSGEQENLVSAHRKFFIQAITELQTAVPCLRFGNTDVYPQCASYFNCGLTTLPKPNGVLTRVYTIGKQSASGTQAGSVIGTVELNPTLIELVDSVVTSSQPLRGTICTIITDGLHTITVNQSNSLGSLYPANSPQYFRTEISYTDTSDIVHTVQPADLIRLSDTSKNGALSIDCKAGTDVTYVITPFNQPVADGTVQIDLTVTFGSLLADADDYCSKVYYQQIEYAYIERYVRACQGCSSSSLWPVYNALVANLFGSWRRKRRYSPPTDVGFENLPPLPHGFHYPQTSTDAGGRSPEGVFAVKHGKIFVAPWIESTESVVVEWNGIKTNWADSDLVPEDPMFIKAVRLNVAIQHYTHYEDNESRLAHFRRDYNGGRGEDGARVPGVLREMIVACREKNRVRGLGEIGAAEGDYAEGVAIVSGNLQTGLYYNEAQSYTSNGVTINIAAGSYSSTLSQADANAAAMAAAAQQAQGQSTATTGSLFSNSPQTHTAECPGASGTTPAAVGTSTTITIPAGVYQSSSQALADATALAAARAVAESQLTCTYYNAPQTVQVTCADSTTESETVPAGQFTASSQSEADQLAKAEAQRLANADCSNPPGAYLIGNTLQIIPYSGSITTSCGITYPFAGTITVPADTFMAQTNAANETIKRAQLNTQAQALATAQIAAARAQQQAFREAACWRIRR